MPSAQKWGARALAAEAWLKASRSFVFFGKGGTYGDRILVDFWDEGPEWWVSLPRDGLDQHPRTFATRDEALEDARRLSALTPAEILEVKRLAALEAKE